MTHDGHAIVFRFDDSDKDDCFASLAQCRDEVQSTLGLKDMTVSMGT
jgi:hypothetical protein